MLLKNLRKLIDMPFPGSLEWNSGVWFIEKGTGFPYRIREEVKEVSRVIIDGISFRKGGLRDE